MRHLILAAIVLAALSTQALAYGYGGYVSNPGWGVSFSVGHTAPPPRPAPYGYYAGYERGYAQGYRRGACDVPPPPPPPPHWHRHKHHRPWWY
uniref:Sulfur globule protein CV3 n=1 Tax=Fundidesulfovibrio putealis TaxID=270496 RepID=A0A7C4EJD1_9BACT